MFYELAEDEYNNYLEEEDDKIEGERENNFKAQVPYDGIDWDEYQNWELLKPILAFLNSWKNELKSLEAIHNSIWVVITGFDWDFHEDHWKIEQFLKKKYVKYEEIIYGYYGDLYLLISTLDQRYKSTICNVLKLDGTEYSDNWLRVNIP